MSTRIYSSPSSLTADLYERNEYGEFDDCSTLLEGSELRGYQDQITAALVKNRMPEETWELIF